MLVVSKRRGPYVLFLSINITFALDISASGLYLKRQSESHDSRETERFFDIFDSSLTENLSTGHNQWAFWRMETCVV